eukprot:COSAG04_NODE_30869_length_260_cov_0.639752_1_plen_50_part_01
MAYELKVFTALLSLNGPYPWPPPYPSPVPSLTSVATASALPELLSDKDLY